MKIKLTIKAILKGAALGLAAVAVAVACSSCDVPLKATIVGHYGVYSYSSKSGLELSVRGDK